MPITAQTNVSHALTSFVVQGLAKRADFIGLEVAPEHGVDHLKDNYPVIELDKGEMLRKNLEKRAPGSAFKRVAGKVSLESFTLAGDGLEIPVPREVVEDNNIPILGVYAEESYLNALRLHEATVASIAQGTGFDTASASVAYTAANLDTIDLPQDIQAAIDTVKGRGEYPDTVVIPEAVWTRAKFAEKSKSFIVGANNPAALVTPENLQKAFADQGIKRVKIGHARENTAAKNKTSISQIWNNDYIWVGAGRDADSNVPGDAMRSAIKTFFWQKLFSGPFFVEQYFQKEIESEIIRAWGYTNERIVNARAGTRITTNYA